MTKVDPEIRPLRPEDVADIMGAVTPLGWHKSVMLFNRYLKEQSEGARVVLVARVDGNFAGYLTVKWVSGYAPFREKGIPEINDFSVLPEMRRNGIGSRLMDAAEVLIAERSAYSGIGVGMGADYGAAQRMYVLRGYLPDGRGLMHNEQPVEYGQTITMGHTLAIYSTKKLR